VHGGFKSTAVRAGPPEMILVMGIRGRRYPRESSSTAATPRGLIFDVDRDLENVFYRARASAEILRPWRHTRALSGFWCVAVWAGQSWLTWPS